MEVQGKIKLIGETQTFGAKGFRKREMVVVTPEQYPQSILIEFIQDKVEILDNFKVGQDVMVHVNLRGREWTNPDGVVKYFNSVQGWRVQIGQNGEVQNSTTASMPQVTPSSAVDVDDDLPF